MKRFVSVFFWCCGVHVKNRNMEKKKEKKQTDGMSDAMTDDSQARDSQVEVDMVFWCKIDNVRVVATVLNTLLNKKSDYQIAYVEITKFAAHTRSDDVDSSHTH